MKIGEIRIEGIFARLTGDAATGQHLADRLQARMDEPPRFYHTEQHIVAVVTCLFDWRAGEPSAPLLAAALYHDAVYDAQSKTNEADSADFCESELALYWGTERLPDPARVCALIMATVRHEPRADDQDETLLCDADLWILGAPRDEYAAYVQAIRQEYAHVSPDDWKSGRARVLRHFLDRPHIYHTDGVVFTQREQAARQNLAAELAALKA